MDRVRVRHRQNHAKTKLARPKEARILIATGKWEPVPPPEPEQPKRRPPAPPPASPADGLDDMAYWDLRALAKERGIEASGTKPEVIAAIREGGAGTYSRRDMRAEE